MAPYIFSSTPAPHFFPSRSSSSHPLTSRLLFLGPFQHSSSPPFSSLLSLNPFHLSSSLPHPSPHFLPSICWRLSSFLRAWPRLPVKGHVRSSMTSTDLFCFVTSFAIPTRLLMRRSRKMPKKEKASANGHLLPLLFLLKWYWHLYVLTVAGIYWHLVLTNST